MSYFSTALIWISTFRFVLQEKELYDALELSFLHLRVSSSVIQIRSNFI